MKFGLNFGLFGGEPSGPSPVILPAVLSSVIEDGQADGILVQWNISMGMSCDIKNQINVLVDGHVEHVTSVEFHPHDRSKMGIILVHAVTAGQTVTWAYDDTGHCDLHQDGVPTNEADNQTYDVTNNLSSPTPSTRAFSSGYAIGFK